MIGRALAAIAGGAALLWGMSAGAQDADAPRAYAYSTYYQCDIARQERADEIVEKSFAPTYDAAVKNGDLTAWGWLVHHTGGEWRRALYYIAPSLEKLFAAYDSVGETIDKANPKASEELASICGAHEDYVWQSDPEIGGSTSGERGDIGFSVYYHCDMNQEGRADEIMKNTIGPLYARQVEAGNLVSWGWLQHNIGGQWRRLLTTSAKDVNSLLKTREALIEELEANHGRASSEFDQICNSHHDYIWNIHLETP